MVHGSRSAQVVGPPPSSGNPIGCLWWSQPWGEWSVGTPDPDPFFDLKKIDDSDDSSLTVTVRNSFGRCQSLKKRVWIQWQAICSIFTCLPLLLFALRTLCFVVLWISLLRTFLKRKVFLDPETANASGTRCWYLPSWRKPCQITHVELVEPRPCGPTAQLW